MGTSKRELVQNLFKEVFSSGDINFLDKVIDQNLKFYDPAAPNFRGGLQAYKQRELAYQKAFAGKKTTIEELFELDNKVVVRWKTVGKHCGDLPGIPATGNKICVEGLMILEFKGDKIIQIWQSWDRLGLLEQLGQVQHSCVEALC